MDTPFLGHEISSTVSEVDFAPLVSSGAGFDITAGTSWWPGPNDGTPEEVIVQ